MALSNRKSTNNTFVFFSYVNIIFLNKLRKAKAFFSQKTKYKTEKLLIKNDLRKLLISDLMKYHKLPKKTHKNGHKRDIRKYFLHLDLLVFIL